MGIAGGTANCELSACDCGVQSLWSDEKPLFGQASSFTCSMCCTAQYKTLVAVFLLGLA